MELFERLINTNFCSGEESPAREIITEAFAPLADRIYTDKCGNLITVFGNEDKAQEKTAVFAPMDAPGLVVTYIEENGTVKVFPLGASNLCSALYQEATDGKITGVLYPDFKDCEKFDATHVNFGFKSREEAEIHLHQGTALFFSKTPKRLENGIVSGVGIGSAACVQTLLSAAKKAEKTEEKCTYFVFTAQSAMNGRGAYQAAYGIKPNKALTVEPYEGTSLAVKVLDKSVVCNEEMVYALECAATKSETTVKRYVSDDEISDAGKVQSAAEGIKTGSLLIPVLHKNTLAEAVDTESISSAASVISEFLNNN